MITRPHDARSAVRRRPRPVWLAAALLPVWACSDGPSDPNVGTDDLPALREQHGAHMDGGTGHAHCGQPYAKDPRDDTMSGELVRVVTNDMGTADPADDQYDLLLPQEVLDWLHEQDWVAQHGDWHNIRRWDQSCRLTPAGQTCRSAEALTARGLKRAPIQEGEPGDGYDFLIMHRHMIRGLRQAFPKHADLFRGFTKIPANRADPENPIPWVNVRWSEEQLRTIDVMENIDEHLKVFDSEDDYAKWVQFGDGFGGGFPGFPGGFPDFGDGGFPGFPGGGFPGFPDFGDGGFPGFPGGGFPGFPGIGGDGGVPSFPGFPGSGGTRASDGGVSAAKRPSGSMHGALHAQWAVPRSPSSLLDNNINVQNFAFWRLHVWLDDMWQLYRDASGLSEDDAAYQQALVAQCEEMHALGEAHSSQARDAGTPADAGAAGKGVFATQIMPIFDAYCAGCHDALGPTLGLTLSGVDPAIVHDTLVTRTASEAPFLFVTPGDPSRSWLFRKVTGAFDGITCTGCKTTMPPAGVKPSDAEVETLRAWITAGAKLD